VFKAPYLSIFILALSRKIFSIYIIYRLYMLIFIIYISYRYIIYIDVEQVFCFFSPQEVQPSCGSDMNSDTKHYLNWSGIAIGSKLWLF
jgi:hypothetical protein